jgi:outer membrane protein TolC
MLQLLLLVSFLKANQGQALTLSEAITNAKLNSPVLLKNRSIQKEAQWKKRESFSGFLPTLSANALHLFDKKLALTNIRFNGASTDTIVPQIIPTSQFSLTSTLPIYEGFASINRYKSASLNEESAQNEFNWIEFKTELDISLIFYKTLASKILKEVAEQNLKVLEDHLKEVKLFKQSGMATNYDILRVEVQVSNAQTDLLSAIDNIAINYQNLLEMMGIDKSNTNDEFNLEGKLPLLTEEYPLKINIDAIYNRSDIKALKNKSLSMKYSDQAQNSYWIPKLNLFGQYQYYNNLSDSFFDSLKFRSAYQIGIQLNWNLFDGLTSFSKSKETTEQLVQAEKTYRIAELKAQKDYDIALRKYQYFINLYKARNNDILKSKESVRLAKEGRRVGSRTNTDLLDAESDLYKSQAGAVNAQIGSIEAFINLENAIGSKIGNIHE